MTVREGARPGFRVPGVQVGHRTLDGTGVTVVLLPEGTVGSGEVRGGAPATREWALLEPSRLVARIDAVVFSGGSAFGLATADGVMRFLEERGRGYATAAGPVPIVPTASIFDLVVSEGRRPGPDDGYAAALDAEASVTSEVERGRVGAGSGATVGKWRGREHFAPGGLGAATVAGEGGVVVGAVVVVNAVGDVVGPGGEVIAGSSAPAGVGPFPDPSPFGGSEAGGPAAGLGALGPGESTTLAAVVTNAVLDKAACHLLAQSAHDGFARALDPPHTRFDGDAALALATGAVPADLDRLRVLAVEVVAAAIRDAVTVG